MTYNLYREIYPFNQPPRITCGLNEWFRPDKIRVTDTTLRDGQQGWRSLSVRECLMIYEALAEIGCGGSIVSTELFLYTSKDREVAARIREYGYEYPKPIGWIRSTVNDLRLVIESRLDETVMLASISDYHIHYKFRVSREQAFEKYLSVVEEALKHGIVVRCALEDVTRADMDRNVIPFVRKVMKLRDRYGVRVRIKIADTLGVGLPYPQVPPPRGIPAIVSRIISECGVDSEDLEFHGHNDFGLVVANHLAAWLSGAALSNCTLFGIGERAGNCPLEVMLIHYTGIRGLDGTVNLKAIPKAANLIRRLGFKIPEFYPLVGENAFRTKAGIHVDGLMKNPEVYLPFNPQSVLGLPYTVAITPYSGRAAIALWINAHVVKGVNGGVSKNDPRVEMIYREVVRMFEEGRREPLRDEEIAILVKKYFPNAVLRREIEERISRVRR